MKKLVLVLITLGVIALLAGILFFVRNYLFLCCVNEDENLLIKSGDALDSLGNKVGTCTHAITKNEHQENKSSGSSYYTYITTKTLFYNMDGESIGECHTYNGPGASGGAGTGCTGEIIRQSEWGTWTDYSCSVW